MSGNHRRPQSARNFERECGNKPHRTKGRTQVAGIVTGTQHKTTHKKHFTACQITQRFRVPNCSRESNKREGQISTLLFSKRFRFKCKVSSRGGVSRRRRATPFRNPDQDLTGKRERSYSSCPSSLLCRVGRSPSIPSKLFGHMFNCLSFVQPCAEHRRLLQSCPKCCHSELQF